MLFDEMEIENLLENKWTNLLKNYKNLKNGQYPGVYILAYTDKNLEEKSIEIKDIFYVGMSNSLGGVRQRLSQFIRGLHKGRGHSAGNRFFTEYSKEKSFDIAGHKKTFFVASLSLPCKVKKAERTSGDLRKMGEVARFEYSVLAHIKQVTGKEPVLNKK